MMATMQNHDHKVEQLLRPFTPDDQLDLVRRTITDLYTSRIITRSVMAAAVDFVDNNADFCCGWLPESGTSTQVLAADWWLDVAYRVISKAV